MLPVENENVAVPESKPLLLNSVEAGKMLGVNVSTIKRWTDEGKLACHKTAGGHRKFMMQHLVDFVDQHHQDNPQINLFPLQTESDLRLSYHIVKGNFDVLATHVLDQALDGRVESVQQILNGLYLSQHPLHRIYDQVLTPALHRVGEMWENGELGIPEEHLATQMIRDSLIRLQGLVRIPREKIGTAILVNLSDELHDIALKMLANILEVRGFGVLFSGQHTPAGDSEQTLQRYRPDRLYISITYLSHPEETRRELDEWCRLAEQFGIRVFVGGQGFDLLEYSHPIIEPAIPDFARLHTV